MDALQKKFFSLKPGDVKEHLVLANAIIDAGRWNRDVAESMTISAGTTKNKADRFRDGLADLLAKS